VNQEKDFVKNWTADKLLQLEINPDIPQSFHLNWYRKLATSFAQLEDYESEAKAWKAAESLGTASQKVVFAQYARKAEFYMESPPLRTK
jgi:hypothetical protein